MNWLEARVDQLDADSRQRLTTNPLRILDSKVVKTQGLLADAPTLLDALSEESSQRFEAVQHGLSQLEIPYQINPRLVRGLDYYGHTSFKITSDHLGAQATVCGGGRYDGLVQQQGGSSTPAVGWALGMERLMLVLDAAASADSDGFASKLTSQKSLDLHSVNRGQHAEAFSLGLARQLRAAGVCVELDGSSAAFGKQFKRADRSGAAWAAVIGDEEAESGELLLKPLLVKGE